MMVMKGDSDMKTLHGFIDPPNGRIQKSRMEVQQ